MKKFLLLLSAFILLSPTYAHAGCFSRFCDPSTRADCSANSPILACPNKTYRAVCDQQVSSFGSNTIIKRTCCYGHGTKAIKAALLLCPSNTDINTNNTSAMPSTLTTTTTAQDKANAKANAARYAIRACDPKVYAPCAQFCQPVCSDALGCWEGKTCETGQVVLPNCSCGTKPIVAETPVVVEPIVPETPVVVKPIVPETPVVVEPTVPETPVVDPVQTAAIKEATSNVAAWELKVKGYTTAASTAADALTAANTAVTTLENRITEDNRLAGIEDGKKNTANSTITRLTAVNGPIAAATKTLGISTEELRKAREYLVLMQNNLRDRTNEAVAPAANLKTAQGVLNTALAAQKSFTPLKPSWADIQAYVANGGAANNATFATDAINNANIAALQRAVNDARTTVNYWGGGGESTKAAAQKVLDDALAAQKSFIPQQPSWADIQAYAANGGAANGATLATDSVNKWNMAALQMAVDSARANLALAGVDGVSTKADQQVTLAQGHVGTATEAIDGGATWIGWKEQVRLDTLALTNLNTELQNAKHDVETFGGTGNGYRQDAAIAGGELSTAKQLVDIRTDEDTLAKSNLAAAQKSLGDANAALAALNPVVP